MQRTSFFQRQLTRFMNSLHQLSGRLCNLRQVPGAQSGRIHQFSTHP